MKRMFFILFAVLCAGICSAQITIRQTVPAVTLHTGYTMPMFGLGTWTLKGALAENAVYTALQSGYRLIDTAKYYSNETDVGNALRRAISDGICTREQVFITTKLVPWTNTPDKDIEDSLKKLGVEYIDLCLLHQHGAKDDEVYRAMERGVKAGKIRSIGISNFYTEKAVQYFIDNFEIPPAVVQNENHIFYQSTVLQKYIAEQGIYIESYYPLGGRGHIKEHLTNPIIEKIAKTHRKTSAQIILRWHVQSGFIVIPGSQNPAHIQENIDIFDFELSAKEMEDIAFLNKNKRHERW